jgi:hypothetical protein
MAEKSIERRSANYRWCLTPNLVVQVLIKADSLCLPSVFASVPIDIDVVESARSSIVGRRARLFCMVCILRKTQGQTRIAENCMCGSRVRIVFVARCRSLGLSCCIARSGGSGKVRRQRQGPEES